MTSPRSRRATEVSGGADAAPATIVDACVFVNCGAMTSQISEGLAGLMESGGRDAVRANGLAARVHERMPAILEPDDEALWLDPEVTDPAAVLGCLGPYPDELMTAYPVSTAVNAVGNDGPELIRPVVGTLDGAADDDAR